MNYALTNTLVRLAGSATGPFGKFSTWLSDINKSMVVIGPAVAGICIAICVVLIAISNDRDTGRHFKKIIVILLAAACLANVTLLIEWAGNLVQYFFSYSSCINTYPTYCFF